MAVEHALGLAGGSGRVAEGGCRALVEPGPGKVVVGLLHQLLVAVKGAARRQARRGHVLGVGHHDHGGGAVAEPGDQPLDQRDEGEVDEQDTVLGMVDDVGDLPVEEPRVDGVDHGTHAGDGEVELVVAVAVPGQGADAIARGYAQALEHAGQPAGAPLGITVGVAMARAFDRVADDLRLAVMPGGEGQQRRDQQRLLLHQAEHGGTSRPTGPIADNQLLPASDRWKNEERLSSTLRQILWATLASNSRPILLLRTLLGTGRKWPEARSGTAALGGGHARSRSSRQAMPLTWAAPTRRVPGLEPKRPDARSQVTKNERAFELSLLAHRVVRDAGGGESDGGDGRGCVSAPWARCALHELRGGARGVGGCGARGAGDGVGGVQLLDPAQAGGDPASGRARGVGGADGGGQLRGAAGRAG